MDPAQTSSMEAPLRNRSPYQPPLNGAEFARREIHSSIPRTDPEMHIFSPIPTRSRLPQVAEAGCFTTDIAMKLESTSRAPLAGINRRPSTEVAAIERHRHLSSVSRRHHRIREAEAPFQKPQAKQLKVQESKERRARKHQKRRLPASGMDCLASSLDNLSTNERKQNDRESSLGRPRRPDRKDRARQDGRAWDHGSAEGAQRIGDDEQSTQSGADEMDLIGSEGLADGAMDTDKQSMDTTSVYGRPSH